MKDHRNAPFWSGLLVGFSELCAFSAPVKPIRYPHRSDTDALRGDWQKVGDDMRVAIRRAHEETKTKAR